VNDDAERDGHEGFFDRAAGHELPIPPERLQRPLIYARLACLAGYGLEEVSQPMSLFGDPRRQHERVVTERLRWLVTQGLVTGARRSRCQTAPRLQKCFG